MNLERDAYRERMLLKGFIFLFTAWYLGAFLWVAYQRGAYPYALGYLRLTLRFTPILLQALQVWWAMTFSRSD
jgi:hypothetical protein